VSSLEEEINFVSGDAWRKCRLKRRLTPPPAASSFLPACRFLFVTDYNDPQPEHHLRPRVDSDKVDPWQPENKVGDGADEASTVTTRQARPARLQGHVDTVHMHWKAGFTIRLGSVSTCFCWQHSRYLPSPKLPNNSKHNNLIELRVSPAGYVLCLYRLPALQNGMYVNIQLALYFLDKGILNLHCVYMQNLCTRSIYLDPNKGSSLPCRSSLLIVSKPTVSPF